MTTTETKNDNTTVTFDLEKVLSEKELAQFKKQANGGNLTEHFLNVTVRNKKEELN